MLVFVTILPTYEQYVSTSRKPGIEKGDNIKGKNMLWSIFSLRVASPMRIENILKGDRLRKHRKVNYTSMSVF